MLREHGVPPFQVVVGPAAAHGRIAAANCVIECPVVAIHGSYDPHPADGVSEPLAHNVRDFRMVILDQCGHTPWRERRAVDDFYGVLEREI